VKATARPCPELESGLTVPQLGDVAFVACMNNQAAACTNADRGSIKRYSDCVAELPTCSSATAEAWQAELQGCSDELSGLSSTCAALLQQ
jgi:hypothetical protein